MTQDLWPFLPKIKIKDEKKQVHALNNKPPYISGPSNSRIFSLVLIEKNQHWFLFILLKAKQLHVRTYFKIKLWFILSINDHVVCVAPKTANV